MLFIISVSALIILSFLFIKRFFLQPKSAGISQAKTQIPCPVPKEFCKSVITISRDNISYVGYNVPDDTPIFSVTKGVIRVGASGGGKNKIPGHPFIFLENSAGTSFSYEYFGSYATPSASLLETGAEIGKVKTPPDGWFDLYKANLIIRAEKSGKLIPLKSGDIGQK